MIDDTVSKRVAHFCERWNTVVASAPVLILDGTWPSVGVIDLLTYRARNRESLERFEERLIKIAASYLAMMAHDCWSQYGVNVRVTDGVRGVVIVAEGGKWLPEGRSFTVEVERALHKILAQTPNPFPVIAGFERQLSASHNFMSLFALGLCSGLSPFGDGPWLNETPETFWENIERMMSFLGRSCVRHYERLFPGEMYGQVGELYLAHLIYPPTCMDEVLPARRAIAELVKFCMQYQLNAGSIRKLALNFAQSPDEQISSVGVALASATHMPPVHRALIGATQAKGTYVGLLRSAMVDARHLFGLRPDWILADGVEEEDILRFEMEKSLGFLPWVYLEPHDFRRKELRAPLKSIFAPLAYFDMQHAVHQADKIVAESPGLIDIRLQRLYLHILNQEFDQAEAGCRALLTEPGCEDEPRLFALWGLNDLWREDRENGVIHLNRAFEQIPVDHPKRSEIANDYAWALMVSEQFGEALPILDIAIESNPFPLTSLLNKSFVLRVLGRDDEAEKCFQQVLPLAPLDRRVFAGIKVEEIVDAVPF